MKFSFRLGLCSKATKEVVFEVYEQKSLIENLNLECLSERLKYLVRACYSEYIRMEFSKYCSKGDNF